MAKADVVVVGAGLAGLSVCGYDQWVAGYMEGAVRTGRGAARALLG